MAQFSAFFIFSTELTIKLELDIGDFDKDPYRAEGYSHIDENYKKLKDFVKKHTVDVEGTLNAQANMGDIEINVMDKKARTTEFQFEGETVERKTGGYEDYVKATMSVQEVFNTSHLEGGAGIDDSDIQTINEKRIKNPKKSFSNILLFFFKILFTFK